VNLTCGRNPWKQASFEDSTYRAFATSQDFLKTILPVSDELNDILVRIFARNPDQRITLPELRARIIHCPRFTEQPAMMPTPSASPERSTVYVNYDESAIDDEYDYDEPLSPLSDSMSDGESTCSSDEGSLTSSVSSIEDDFEDDEDEFLGDLPEAKTPPPQALRQEPAIYEPEDASVMRFRQEYLHPFACPPAQEPLHPMALPFHPACGPKFVPEPFAWDRMKFAPSAPPLYQPVPFHHQVPALFIPLMQGCY
jgi:serine/threonine protein kinase